MLDNQALWAFSPERIHEPVAQQQLAALEAFVFSGKLRADIETQQAVPEATSTRQSIRELGVSAVKKVAVLTALLPITNEPIRYGLTAAATAQTDHPGVGAFVLGASTLAVEGAGVLGAADWVTKNRFNDVIDQVSNKLEGTKFSFLAPKKYFPEKPHLSLPARAGLAMTMGSIVSMQAKQMENPTDSVAENKERGLKTAGWLASLCAVEGAMIAKGVEKVDNPLLVIGASFLASAGIAWAWNKARSHFSSDKPPYVGRHSREYFTATA